MALAGGASAAVYLPTKGPVPPSANGVINLKNVPVRFPGKSRHGLCSLVEAGQR